MKRRREEHDDRWPEEAEPFVCPDDVERERAGLKGKSTPPASEWAGEPQAKKRPARRSR